MLKKLAISATAVATFSLCTGVLADSMDPSGLNGTGFYIRGEGGYGWANSKDATVIDFPQGVIPPFGTQAILSSNNKKSRGLTGRIAAGYTINQYFSVETGFNLYHPITRALTIVSNIVPLPKNTTSFSKTSLFSLDLMGKATIPLNKFFAFAEVGAAFVHAKNNAVISNAFDVPVVTFIKPNSKGFIRPKVGAGFGYNLNSNLAIDISYSRIFGKGGSIDSPNFLPSLNTATIGLTYKF